MLNKQRITELAGITTEAAAALQKLMDEHPNVYRELGLRYPMVDELDGFSFILKDALKSDEQTLATAQGDGVNAAHHANHHSQSAGSVALQLLEAIRSTHPELIADNLPSGWGMNRLRAEIHKTTLSLNAFDPEGNVADGDGKTVALSTDQLSDIVDHAAQLTLLRREGKELGGVLDELEEALSAADVLPEQSQPPADDQPAPSN